MSNDELRFKSVIKGIVADDLKRNVEKVLALHLLGSRFLHMTSPTPDTHDQLLAMEAACREIRQHIEDLKIESAYETSLNVLLLPNVFKEL